MVISRHAFSKWKPLEFEVFLFSSSSFHGEVCCFSKLISSFLRFSSISGDEFRCCAFVCGVILFQDASGNLSAGAIADLVDEVGGAVIYTHGQPMKVSVDMSITYLSQAKAHVCSTDSHAFT